MCGYREDIYAYIFYIYRIPKAAIGEHYRMVSLGCINLFSHFQRLQIHDKIVVSLVSPETSLTELQAAPFLHLHISYFVWRPSVSLCFQNFSYNNSILDPTLMIQL